MPEAAAVPLVGLTAWQAFVERAKVTAGQEVLVHAGSGGVGTMAIQLAEHLGATVATTTSTANVDWVTSLGADVVVDYRPPHPHAREATWRHLLVPVHAGQWGAAA
jgi:alcohol dehydrogenase